MCSSWLLYLCRKCLLTPLSASVKLLWKCLKILPWHIWVTALWMSWITYACHITGLCCLLLVIGYRFSSIACVALTWPIVWHGCWEADTVFQLATLAGFFPGKGLHPAHDVYFCLFSISLTFIINVSHMSKDWGLLPFHRMERIFTVTLPFPGYLLSPKAVEAIPFCPHAVKFCLTCSKCHFLSEVPRQF